MQRAAWLGIAVALVWAAAAQAPAPRTSSCAGLTRIDQYIRQGWTTLERSNARLLQATLDAKTGPKSRAVLYAPADEWKRVENEVRRTLPPGAAARVAVLPLPADTTTITEPGLLYVPHPYVVPGGRFNELYGWDSYFILRGLLADGELRLARDMTDDLLYEVEHYGKVLNANRTYYLTRSQPPFLSRMVLEIFARTGGRQWLEHAAGAIGKYYEYWTSGPHLTPKTGLSRYCGGAATPAPEVVEGERDAADQTHYQRVVEYYRTHTVSEYDISRYYDSSTGNLTPLFYLADRAMRESGFDPSGRFGPFSAGILNYNPVDLNSLLYRMEMDLAAIDTLLDRPRQARTWTERAARRAVEINRLMWNPEAGLYFDYNFERGTQSGYHFITTFYPLWAGLASPEQAARVAANLPIFERAGGLETSDRVTGDQWDAPFGWAPVEMIAAEGLRRYGFDEAADRISLEFLTMVLHDFELHGTIREKYDVVTARSDLAAGLKFGYTSNEIGFGWTNAAFLVLSGELSEPAKERLRQACHKNQH